jgi:hypothetical protein
MPGFRCAATQPAKFYPVSWPNFFGVNDQFVHHASSRFPPIRAVLLVSSDPMSPAAILRDVFGYGAFRGAQTEIGMTGKK